MLGANLPEWAYIGGGAGTGRCRNMFRSVSWRLLGQHSVRWLCVWPCCGARAAAPRNATGAPAPQIWVPAWQAERINACSEPWRACGMGAGARRRRIAFL